MSVVRVKVSLLKTPPSRSRVFTSATVEEFYNSHHSKSDGRFSSGGGGSTDWHRVGTDSKYAKEKGLSLPVLPGKNPAKAAESLRQEHYHQQRKELEKSWKDHVSSNASPDAPTYKGRAAIMRALSKAEDKFGRPGTFEFTDKQGQRFEMSVHKVTGTHLHGDGGFGDLKIPIKSLVSARPMGFASNDWSPGTEKTGHTTGHQPFAQPTPAHIRHTVRKHTTPNFIDTNNVRHVKTIDDWTAKFPNGNRHPTGVTGHTTVRVKKGLRK